MTIQVIFNYVTKFQAKKWMKYVYIYALMNSVVQLIMVFIFSFINLKQDEDDDLHEQATSIVYLVSYTTLTCSFLVIFYKLW